MPTYPGGGDRITVEALLKMPQLIARPLTALAAKKFVADRIFAKGSPDQVRGGAALFQRSESIYPARAAEEVGVRSAYPRTGWTEEVMAAMVKKYGLEVPISDEAKRRNQLDVVQRAQRKLANAVVKFVDSEAIALFIADAAVLTDTASADWTTAGTDIVADIASFRQQIVDQNEGYEPNIMLVNSAQELDLITDADIRNALPRESSGAAAQNPVQTGRAAPILGLDAIISTPQVTAGTVIVLEQQTVGTIADEAPAADEGYVSYQPGDNPTGGGAFPTLYLKLYREDGSDETIARAARFPAMWLAEPKAALVATGA